MLSSRNELLPEAASNRKLSQVALRNHLASLITNAKALQLEMGSLTEKEDYPG